jgi:hypothetical protein
MIPPSLSKLTIHSSIRAKLIAGANLDVNKLDKLNGSELKAVAKTAPEEAARQLDNIIADSERGVTQVPWL